MSAKLIKDGKVAVLVSPGFGAGWSSWCEGGPGHTKEDLMFSPELAACIIEGGDREEVARRLFPKQYLGGLTQLRIDWIPIGTRFRVDEYDGSEGIAYADDEMVVA